MAAQLYLKLCSLEIFSSTSQSVVFIDNHSAKHYSRRFIHWRLFLHAHTVFVAFRLMAFSWCMYHYGHNEQVIWTRYLQYDPSMAIVLGMRSIINFDSLTGLVFVLIIIVHFSFDYVLYFHNRVKKCDQRLWVIFFSLITKNGSLSFSQRGKKSFEDWLHNDCLNLRALPGELRHLWKCSKIKLVAQFPVWPHLFPPIRTALVIFNNVLEPVLQFIIIIAGLISPFFFLFNLMRIILTGKYGLFITVFGSLDIILSIVEMNIFLHNTIFIFHFGVVILIAYGAQLIYLNRFLTRFVQSLQRKKNHCTISNIRKKINHFFVAHSFTISFQLWLNSSTYMHVLFLLTFNLVPVSVYFISLLYLRNLSNLEHVTYSFAIYLIAFINLCTLQPLVVLARLLTSSHKSVGQLMLVLSDQRKRMLRDRLSLLNYYTKLSCHEALKFRLDPVGIVTQRNLVEVKITLKFLMLDYLNLNFMLLVPLPLQHLSDVHVQFVQEVQANLNLKKN